MYDKRLPYSWYIWLANGCIIDFGYLVPSSVSLRDELMPESTPFIVTFLYKQATYINHHATIVLCSVILAGDIALVTASKLNL